MREDTGSVWRSRNDESDEQPRSGDGSKDPNSEESRKENTMKRRILQFTALAAALIFLFSGCSGSVSGLNSDVAETGKSSENAGTADSESVQAAWDEAAQLEFRVTAGNESGTVTADLQGAVSVTPLIRKRE